KYFFQWAMMNTGRRNSAMLWKPRAMQAFTSHSSVAMKCIGRRVGKTAPTDLTLLSAGSCVTSKAYSVRMSAAANAILLLNGPVSGEEDVVILAAMLVFPRMV